ncbi:D-amino acid dehydrogenase [Limobrevibacterium gyesilva]|uniref:D-amino acid dehydrogenase n=1 Tax=Limobrevibacterium gyesilva TaxID=2991712 RepID=A0AA41YSB5_9PROT|nr:D-amino acid dehydrogenase [Limobrevibacterium gyesilva]
MKIIVLGAGIVGMTTAWWLAQDGHEVTVLDRAAAVGQGTSFANGAQLSFSYVAPMASPAVLRSLPKYLLEKGSPIRFVPSADPGQWLWLAEFLRACNAHTAAATTAQMLALSFHSRDALHEMLARTPMEFLHRRNGKLVVQSSREGMVDAEAQLRLQAAMGCEQQALTAQDCLALEPGLESIRHRLVGGIYTPSEEVGDCHMLCQELQRVLSPRVQCALGTEVQQIVTANGRVTGLRTDKGVMEADLYVLAAGVASRVLGRDAGLRLRVQPIRGYSITAQVRNGNRAPVRSITDIHRKTVYAPLGDSIRVAGFAEVGAAKTELRPDRIATLAQTLEETFPGTCSLDDVRPWSGLRPATPTDKPVIGRTRLDNLMLNLGHGSLGFTLSAGSARLLADIVAGRRPGIPEADYRLAM